MDLRRRLPPKPPSATVVNHQKAVTDDDNRSSSSTKAGVLDRSPSPVPKASDALPLPLYLTNGIFFTLFFCVAYYLLHRWRDKMRSSTPLHVVTLAELAAIVSLVASFIYLLGFFGIDFVQSFITTSRGEEDSFVLEGEVELHSEPKPRIIDPVLSITLTSEEDEEIVKNVVCGAIPSYALESKLGDCLKAASIRRQALEITTGRSLLGLPLEGFDYESILGQCCEMPVGYVQLPVGIAGPLLLNGCEYMVPMATTEGCLVASTNRGCKAIFASGGATSILLKDGMTRAPVVRFATAERASQLKFFLEDANNFDTLSVIFIK